MDSTQAFSRFLMGQDIQIPVVSFVINLAITAILAYILGLVYRRYGQSLSNRRLFGKNFMMISMTTMLIIAIVKSSLALSLGLVGALSIVRFRAAIKEPEELSYLFIAIAIGLGLGADQRGITIVAFIIIMAIILMRVKLTKPDDFQNLHLTVSTVRNKAELSPIVDMLREHCLSVNMKRFDETKDVLEVSFLVEFENFEQLEKTRYELRKFDDNVKIAFFDNKALV